MRLPWLLLAATALQAHMISMSSGDIAVKGTRAHYELRMPLYEIAHVRNPEQSLFANIRFSSGGREARLLGHTCRADDAAGSYFCAGDYEFAAPVDRLEVECSFPSITVTNHVHLLRATREGKNDQALLDFSFPKATLRFDPPGAAEVAFTQFISGMGRAVGGAVQLLFLAALVLAARGRRELAALAGMFLAGQVLSAAIVPLTRWQPAPRFVEAAAALTVAYLAVEILLLPKAGARWLVSGVLGAFHGLYFALFLRTAEYNPVWVMAGAAVADAAVVVLLALVFSRVGRIAAAFRPVPVCAGVLLAVGMVWFFMRVAG